MTDPTPSLVDAAVAKHAPRVQVGRDRAKGGRVEFSLAPHILPLLGYWNRLERIYDGFKRAAGEVEKARGAPICVDGCGKCCHTIPVSTGVEAEYAGSVLLGTENLGWALDRAREWLTSKPAFTAVRKRSATYGRAVTRALYDETLHQEMRAVIETETCPFLKEDLSCGVWLGRPAVCRAYGSTHVPNPWCSRPLGFGEDQDSRVSWNGAVPLTPGEPSLKQQVADLRESVGEPRYAREGFFPMMLFERFRAAELAGLVDDGRVPTARMTVGIGGTLMTLWQDQLSDLWNQERATSYEETDLSIKQQVPLVERDGRWIMRVEA